MMQNPLVSRGMKYFGLAASLLGAVISGLFAVVLVHSIVSQESPQRGATVIWLTALFFGYLAFALVWVAIKTIRNPLPTNRNTMMPRWFLITTVVILFGFPLVVWLAGLIGRALGLL